MYGPPFYPDRPRTDNTRGHARRALEDLMIHNKKVKGGLPSRSRQDDELSKLRNAWPKRFLERQRRDSYQASATAAINRAMLMSQLAQVRAQMPAWGGPAHHVAHREYILDALRRNGTPAPEESTPAPEPAPAPAPEPAPAPAPEPASAPATTRRVTLVEDGSDIDVPSVRPVAKTPSRPKSRARR